MALAPRLLLVIDDDENFLKAIAALLKVVGYGVITSKDGTAGVFMARDNQPDLILLDLMMPSPNGFEIFRLLKKRAETANIPVAFLTARVANADKLAALSMGAVDYITKPFDKNDFVARIEAILSNVKPKSAKPGVSTSAPKHTYDDLVNALVKELPPGHQKYKAHILTMLEFTLKNRFKDPVEQGWYIKDILSNQLLMYGLISDMLILINLDHGHMGDTRPSIDIMSDFYEPIYQRVQLYKEKNLGLNILVQPKIEVRAPKSEFSQCLIHLVNNACKHCPPGGEVTIVLSGVGHGGCTLMVANDGDDIPINERNRIFERHTRLTSPNVRSVSLGIGLYIVRSVAQQLGGNAVVLDSVGMPGEVGIQMYIPPIQSY